MADYTFGIVGESFGNRQHEIEHCRPGDRVILKRERDNPHSEDGSAVNVLSSRGVAIGYIGRDKSGWVSRIIDDGAAISGSIERIVGGTRDKPTRGVIITLLTGDDAQGPVEKYVKIGKFDDIDEPDPPESESTGGGLLTVAAILIVVFLLWAWLA